jgi:hypothetical protein
MLSELSVILAYTVITCPVPFPVVVVAYAFVGFGEALQIAYNNVSRSLSRKLLHIYQTR